MVWSNFKQAPLHHQGLQPRLPSPTLHPTHRYHTNGSLDLCLTPTAQQQLNLPGLADIALADVAIGSAGNQYIPAASVGSRRTLLPLALERCAVAPDAPAPPGVSDSQMRTPWPAWPQGPRGAGGRNAYSEGVHLR